MLSQYSCSGSSFTEMTIVFGLIQRGFPCIFENVSPPPTIDRPPVSIGWSNSTRISFVAGSTSACPLSGAAFTTFGGVAAVEAARDAEIKAAMAICLMPLVSPLVLQLRHPRLTEHHPSFLCH